MWKLYILYSEKIDRYYTGITEDLEWRLERHNQGWGKYTKHGIPWKIVYTEEFDTKSAALKCERVIKARKSKKFIESLINSHAGVVPPAGGKSRMPRRVSKANDSGSGPPIRRRKLSRLRREKSRLSR